MAEGTRHPLRPGYDRFGPMRLSIRAFLLVALLSTAAVRGQDAPVSRPGDSPVVDPALVGTWTGMARHMRLFDAIRFEIGPSGEFKLFISGVPSAFLLEASNGQWAARPAVRRSRPEPLRGTYDSLKRGRTRWWGLLATAPTMTRERAPEASASRPGLTASELNALDTVPELVRALGGTDPAHRGIASLRLAVLAAEHPKEAVEAIPALVEHLRDPTADVRWHCVIALGNLGGDARRAGAALLERLGDPDPSVRHAVVGALRPVVGDPALVVPALSTALADAEASISEAAGHELRELGPHAAAAAAALARAVVRANDDGHGARFALKALDPASAAAAAPVLVNALRQHPDRVVRLREFLVWLGPLAKDAVPVATEILADRSADRRDRAAAADILGAVGPDARSAVPELTAVVNDAKERPELRKGAQDALHRIGGDRDVKLLVQGLSTPRSDPWENARRNLGAMPAEAVATEISRALREDGPFQTPSGRQGVYEFLKDLSKQRGWRHEPVDRRFLELLKTGLADPDSRSRWLAIEGLGEVDEAARKEAAAWITPALQDPSLDVVIATAKVLEEFGNHASDSAPALLVLLRDPDPAVRERWAAGGTETKSDGGNLDAFGALMRRERGEGARSGDAELIARYRAAQARLTILRTLDDLDLYPTLDKKGQVAGAMAIFWKTYDLKSQLRADPRRARQAVALLAPLLEDPSIERFFNKRVTPAIMGWTLFVETFPDESMSQVRADALARIEEATRHPNEDVKKAAAQELERLEKRR
jgi:HEAT repeat protein